MPLLLRGNISSYLGRAETILVAANNAPSHIKAVATYIADGVADNVEIQAAINSLTVGVGGIVQLSEGNFNISATITMNRYILRGAGIGNTTLTTTVSRPLHIGDTTGGAADVVVEGFRIVSSGTLAQGILAQRCIRCWFSVGIQDFLYPFELSGEGDFTANNTIDGGFFRINQNNGIGIQLTNTANFNKIFPNTAGHILSTGGATGTIGIDIVSGNQNVIFPVDLDNLATGIRFQNLDNVAFAPRSEGNVTTFINYGAGVGSKVIAPMGTTSPQPTEAMLFSNTNLWLGTPEQIARFVRRQNMWRFEPLTGWTSVVTGGGLTSEGPNFHYANVNDGSGGTALLRNEARGLQVAGAAGVFNFTNRIEIKIVGYLVSMFTPGVIRWTLGKISTDGIGDPARRAIGFRIDGASALSGIVHNGTTLTVVPLGITWADTFINEVTIVSVNGTVTWFYNNGEVGSTTLGPTGNSSASPQWQVEGTNAGSLVKAQFQVLGLQWWR